MEEDHQEEIQNQIGIEDLELSLEVYELESDQKLEKLKALFTQKKSLDLRQTFYEERSSLQVKFQNIIGDLTEFLVNQEVTSTQKLRKTFYRILQSPLLLLFKVSRFQIFNLRFNAFDIQLDPIDAICELATLLYKSIDEYMKIQHKHKGKTDFTGHEYQSYQHFLQHAKINLIQDQIFVLYSYLRKGTQILKNKMEDKVKIVEIFNTIQEKLIETLLNNQDTKTLKQLATLNYQIYLLQNKFDVLCFYLRIPLRQTYKEIFKELQTIANKSRTTSNFDIFIFIFVKYCKEIMQKLSKEKIDQYYASYIENALTTILELWGVRICHFKQFLDLFKLLFSLYPNSKKILQICLKHTPNLQKQDIALLRANYKHDIEQGQSQLLSLLKKQSLDDINRELNSFYHQIIYNLDFRSYKSQQIMQLLTLMNGNASIQQFFLTVQKAFKQWNHTIDFNHQHKFIQSEFKLPKLKQSVLLESIKLFQNICILESKGFGKEYETLISKGTINKALVGFCNFFTSNQEAITLLKQQQSIQRFILVSFEFLQKSLSSGSADWQNLCLNYSNILQLLGKQIRKKFKLSLTNYIQENIQIFNLRNCLQIFRRIYQCQEESTENKEILSQILNIFMKETSQNNEYIKKFKYIGQSAQTIKSQKLTKSQSQFLQKNCIIQNGKIQTKQTGCFKLSELEIIPNPIQFQKAMDNYYFTLDGNSKRFIQYLILEWHQSLNGPSNRFYSNLIVNMIQEYPICIPILSNVRISPNENDKEKSSSRFAQYLTAKLQLPGSNSKQILISILNCRVIRYRNGKNYIIEQISPMILKKILNIINLGCIQKNEQISVESYEVLVQTFSKIKLPQIKMDIIQKSIQKVNFQISNSSCQKAIARLSKCHFELLYIFFLKKQLQLKKQNLASTYKNLIWNQVRTYTLTGNLSTTNSKKQLTLPKINDQIMVSPFTLSQQYNLEEYKIKNSKNVKAVKTESSDIHAQQILKKMEIKNTTLNHLTTKNSSLVKQIDIKQMKFNLFYHLGQQNIRLLQSKQNITINQGFQCKSTGKNIEKGSSDQNISFIQYYLREMLNPQISNSIATKTILAILKQNLEVSYIMTNPKNLQKFFVPLMAFLEYSINKNTIDPKLMKNKQVQPIVQEINKDKTKALKKILIAFSQIGYTNLWGQSYKSMSSSSVLFSKDIKQLQSDLQIKQIQQESFLAILLKACLQQSEINIKEELNIFLQRVFSTRPKDQTTLMYKVGIDKNLLNLIMKSLEIKNLSNVSFLFHSNFNNLRLYTDQLHEGLKALNMASKTRSYNQYIQLSKQVDDEQFFGPMKLFKENFSFFIKIQKEGYNFKKSEQIKLTTQRISNSLRNYSPQKKQAICKQCDKILQDFIKQVEALQLSIANRVKSFYLVTKLRDLTYQNSITIGLMREVLSQKKLSPSQILLQIQKIDIFSLLLEMQSQLVLFDNNWNNENAYKLYHLIDRQSLKKQISICSTRRYSHSMNRIYEKCDLQFDEIIQRCFDVLKMYLSTPEGVIWIQKHINFINPAFLVKSFVKKEQANQLFTKIKYLLEKTEEQQLNSEVFTLNQKTLIGDLVKNFRQCNKKLFYLKNKIVFNLNAKQAKPEEVLLALAKSLTMSQTLVQTKSKQSRFLTFNKYKTSQATLEEIQALGYMIGYCIYHKINLNLKLHTSLIAALSFNICDIDDLLDIDFKIWQDIKKVLSLQDSKTLNLNFSYLFENIKTLQSQRVQLTDKGASKKVNNLNRDEYCDLVCCYVLYKNISQQVQRLIEGILRIIPKQMISCLSISEVFSLFYGNQNQRKLVQQVEKKYMRKIGIVTPQMTFFNNQKVQNLKDYQNIQWLQEILFEDQKTLQKFWKKQSNIFILTTISSKPGILYKNQTFVINHFQNKEQMKAQLFNLKI